MTRVFQGDCKKVIEKDIDSQSVNLIVTSPPYADQRNGNYGGIHPDQYVDWFLPKAQAFKECLAPDGSFVLNIKEKALDGEKHPYVYDLVLALRRNQGWRLVDEYCWHKKNCYPGKWPNRFRDSWERLYHFVINPAFKMRQEEVMVPMGDWKDKRLANLSETDSIRDESKHDNGFGKRIENWVGRDMAYPTNVLHMATECAHKGHPAAFPKDLPKWFIRLFTDKGDTVLDPFAGSGTTLVAALELGRKAIGIDTKRPTANLYGKRFVTLPPPLIGGFGLSQVSMKRSENFPIGFVARSLPLSRINSLPKIRICSAPGLPRTQSNLLPASLMLFCHPARRHGLVTSLKMLPSQYARKQREDGSPAQTVLTLSMMKIAHVPSCRLSQE